MPEIKLVLFFAHKQALIEALPGPLADRLSDKAAEAARLQEPQASWFFERWLKDTIAVMLKRSDSQLLSESALTSLHTGSLVHLESTFFFKGMPQAYRERHMEPELHRVHFRTRPSKDQKIAVWGDFSARHILNTTATTFLTGQQTMWLLGQVLDIEEGHKVRVRPLVWALPQNPILELFGGW